MASRECNRYKCVYLDIVVEVTTLEGSKYVCSHCLFELESYIRQQKEGITRYELLQKVTGFFYSEKGIPIGLDEWHIGNEFNSLVESCLL